MKIKVNFISVAAIFLSIAFTVSFFHLSPVYGQAITPTVTATPTSDYYKEQFELLKEVALKHEDRVNTEREDLVGLSKLVLELFAAGGFIALLSFIATLIGINQKAKKYLNQVITNKGGDLKNDAEKWAKGVVYGQFGFDKNILVLADKEDGRKFGDMEAKLLERRGFSKINIVSADADIQPAEMIIFLYKESLIKNLSDLIDKLSASKSQVPLLIYHRGSVNVDRNITNKYDMHTFAQSPLTLVSWTFTILSSMPYHKEHL